MIAAGLVLVSAFFVGGGCRRNAEGESKYSDSLLVAPSGNDAKYLSYRDGRQQLTYAVDSKYPAENVLSFLSTELQKRGWKPLREDFLNPGLPSSHVRGWVMFKDATQTTTATVWAWTADWENMTHDITMYALKYEESQNTTLGLKTLLVVAIYIPVDVATKMKADAAAEMKRRGERQK